MTSIKQKFSVPYLQNRLDTQMQDRVAKHNEQTTKVTKIVSDLQKISLDSMRNEDGAGFKTIEADYHKILQNAKQLLPSSAGNITPVSWDNSNCKQVSEQVQNQIEYLQLLFNNEQTKDTNSLDLSLKNYFAISNTLSEISKTIFGFIKHVLGNSTGR